MHDPASDCWYVNTRTRSSGPATAYDRNNPAAYYSQLSPRLALENRTVDANGFVCQGEPDGGSSEAPPRVEVSQTVLEGVVGQHISVSVNGSFDDAEEVRRADLPLAVTSAVSDVRGIMQGGGPQAAAGTPRRRCYNIGIIYNFLLSGEMKNGQKAEERADGGIFKKVVSVRCWPRGKLEPLLQRSARDVVAEMIDRVDEGGDSIFYGVSHWRLLRVDISVSPVERSGRGGESALSKLQQEELPVGAFLRSMKRNTVLYSPPVKTGCFLHCLARAKRGSKCVRSGRRMPFADLSRVQRPGEYDTDGQNVPCSQDIVQAFASANGLTINVFVPAEKTTPPPYLLDPVVVAPKGDASLTHVDLLYYDDHWMLILNIGRLLRGWDSGINCPLCRYCLAVINVKRGEHVCNEDATTLSIRPAADDAFYTASNAMFAGRLPLTLTSALELTPLPAPTGDDANDELSFTLSLCQNTELGTPAVEKSLIPVNSGRTVTDLLRALRHLAFAALGKRGLMRRFATRYNRTRNWSGEDCAACHESLTGKTAVYHHDHLYGNFIAWVCQRCNKAEAMRDVVVVTRGLKEVASLLISANDNLGLMRISHVGDWKSPLSLNVSWREGKDASRFGVRLISMEKLCNSADGNLGQGSLSKDVKHLRTLLWDSLGIEPMRFMTLPQVAEAACLTMGAHRFRLPHTEEQMRLFSHAAGGLVFAAKGEFVATPVHSIAEFDITKCFGALLQERVATDISPAPLYFCAGDDWRSPEFRDSWVAAQVDTHQAWGMANVTLPSRIEAGLPVPREVLLALEACGARVQPISYLKVKYDTTHTGLIGALSELHARSNLAGDKPAAQVAKAMMVTSYGKLAQNDRAWPAQQVVMSPRDTYLGGRQILPSLRVELVKEATHELHDNVWEIEPLLQTYPRQPNHVGRRDIRVLCVEDLRQRLCGHPGICVLRIFYRSYLVVECERHTLEEFVQAQNLSGAVTYEQRSDEGIEVITRASSRAKTASRPVYAGQDIAMRSWAKIFWLLGAVVKRFGKGNVFVIRIMVDCLTLYVRHPVDTDASAEIRRLPEAGDGTAMGSWKDEFDGQNIDTWFQLNKTGYEVRYHAVDGGHAGVKRRLGGIPKIDRDALPSWTFDAIIKEGKTIPVKTHNGIVSLRLK